MRKVDNVVQRRVCTCSQSDVAGANLPFRQPIFHFKSRYFTLKFLPHGVSYRTATARMGCAVVWTSLAHIITLFIFFWAGMLHINATCSLVCFLVPDAQETTHLCLETASGHSQWEPPAQNSPPVADHLQPAGSPPPTHHAKRRQYAPGQTQAYYGGDGLSDPSSFSGPAGGIPSQPVAGGQLFTPGLVGEQQFQAQQQQASVQGQGQSLPPQYYALPGEQQPEYMGGSGPVYGQPPQPVYGAGAGSGQHPVDALSGQFGGMGLGPGMAGQKAFSLLTTNLLTSPPEPRELHRPPPEIRLPPNSCLSPSPSANADPSYQRCTLNAIPTTASLLAKSKIPLALVLAPYRSLKDGDEAVPVVSDTVIARCRRCRTYINPYVQFIDGGNR